MTVVDEIRRDPEQGARRLDSEYRAGLTTLARRICADPGDADELVNRTFAEVVANIDRYAEQSAFFGWMSKILVNLNANDHRRQSVKNEVLPGDLQDCPDEDAQEAIFRNLDHSLLRDAVGQLSPEMRDVVVMRYFMDLPLSRIAKLLSVPEGTVNSRLHYARLALAAKLGAAAKKPGGKALLVALALCGLTALGAAVVNLANNGGSRKSADAPAILASSTADQPDQPDPSDPADQPDPSDPSDPSDQPDPSDPSGITGWTGMTGMTGWTGTNLPLSTESTTDMKKKSLLAAALGTAALATTTASADTLHLTASDASGKSSFITWNVSGGGTAAPSSGNDYVNEGYTIRTPNKTSGNPITQVFSGGSLTMGDYSAGKAGNLAITQNTNQVIRFDNDGVVLRYGRFVPYISRKEITYAGTITVESPKGRPYLFEIADTSGHPANTNVFSATIKGGADAEFAIVNSGAENPNGYAILQPSTDTSFAGTLTIGKVDYGLRPAASLYPVRAEYRSTRTWPGTIHVKEGSLLRAQYGSTRWTMGSLVLDSGATLHLRVNGSNCSTITLTESLDVAKGAILDIGGAPGESDKTAKQWIVMTLPQDKGTIPLENFTLSGVPSFPSALPKYTLETNAVGNVWQLILKKSAHDFLKTNDDTGGYSAAAEVSSAMTTDASWAGGTAPSAGCDYVAQKDKGGLTAYPIIRTPYQSEQYDFPGDSLILGSGGQLLPCSKEVAFPLLVLSANTAYILSLPGNGTHLRGAIQTIGGSDTYPQKIQAYMSGLNTVDADISGNGAIWVTGRNSSTNPYGDIEFTAFNTNFTGKIKVCAVGPTESSKANPPSDSDYKHERLFVTDARNLGGALDEFRADALELADYSVLEARKDVDLNVANRGVKVTGNAGFAAPENVTLAISNDVTWNGTARKTGAGTLALGAAPRIASGSTAALEVKEGFLKALSTNALNGVAVTFDDGAYLLVDPATTDVDLASFGAVDLSPDPFGGELPVAFELPALEGESDSYRYANVAVATVKDAATASDLDLSARKIKGHGVTFATRANDDGTVTILASISQNAFVMVVR